RVRVEKGRLVLDEPTTLPDGTVVDLVADDEGDDLTDQEREALHDALSASWKSAEAGDLRPASAILNELRQRRRRALSFGQLPSQTHRSAKSTTGGAAIGRQPQICFWTNLRCVSTSSVMRRKSVGCIGA